MDIRVVPENVSVSFVESYFEREKTLFLVNEKEQISGVIGEKEFECLKRNRKEGMTAKDICNKSFRYVLEGNNKIQDLIQIFKTTTIFWIPVVDAKMNILEIVGRNLFNFFYRHVISFAQFEEDVILLSVLEDYKNIFYIDVGAFDPYVHSVTKLLYDRGARGINIEPQPECCKKILNDRKRDITLCCAAVNQGDKKTMWQYGGNSTLEEKFKKNGATRVLVPGRTLKEICEENVNDNQEIHFLKVDVEGYEWAVLAGMDFNKYRPWIVMMEAIEPNTLEPYYPWEDELESADYVFVKQYDINRYYVAKEKLKELKDKFVDKDKIENMYHITHISW